MSYDWWSRVDRAMCRVAGHTWVDAEFHWLEAASPFSACVRCGNVSEGVAPGRHRLVRA